MTEKTLLFIRAARSICNLGFANCFPVLVAPDDVFEEIKQLVTTPEQCPDASAKEGGGVTIRKVFDVVPESWVNRPGDPCQNQTS